MRRISTQEPPAPSDAGQPRGRPAGLTAATESARAGGGGNLGDFVHPEDGKAAPTSAGGIDRSTQDPAVTQPSGAAGRSGAGRPGGRGDMPRILGAACLEPTALQQRACGRPDASLGELHGLGAGGGIDAQERSSGRVGVDAADPPRASSEARWQIPRRSHRRRGSPRSPRPSGSARHPASDPATRTRAVGAASGAAVPRPARRARKPALPGRRSWSRPVGLPRTSTATRRHLRTLARPLWPPAAGPRQCPPPPARDAVRRSGRREARGPRRERQAAPAPCPRSRHRCGPRDR